ncbi:MAG: aldose epimerase family protein [Pseudomonadota bacterium]
METIATHEGRDVRQAILRDGEVSVTFLSFGAILSDWRVPDRRGVAQSVTLGFDQFAPYRDSDRAFGIIAGRVANRIKNARFPFEGTVVEVDRNLGEHHIHGGALGLGRQHFDLEADASTARLTLKSPDGAMGYPGNVDFTFDIALKGHTLTFDLKAVPDRPTPVALAQHSYFRLGAPAQEHVMTIHAANTTALDEALIPTGAIVPVEGTALDFRAPRTIGDTQIDRNFCLDQKDPAVVLETEAYALTLRTDRPGLQVYNGFNFPTFDVAGHDGIHYGPYPGIALEAQDFPDALNNPSFPSIIVTPDRPYRQVTSITITPKD